MKTKNIHTHSRIRFRTAVPSILLLACLLFNCAAPAFCEDTTGKKDLESVKADLIREITAKAEKGDTSAQKQLGFMYLEGPTKMPFMGQVGVAQDSAKALDWFRRAASQGDAEAPMILAICYLSGTGVEKNEAEGIRWLRQSATNGNADARKLLREIENSTSAAGTASAITNGESKQTSEVSSLDRAGEAIGKTASQVAEAAKSFYQRNQKTIDAAVIGLATAYLGKKIDQAFDTPAPAPTP